MEVEIRKEERNINNEYLITNREVRRECEKMFELQ